VRAHGSSGMRSVGAISIRRLKSAPVYRFHEANQIRFPAPAVKVRVRIDTLQYLDYLSYHCINDTWLITAKSFHVEQRCEPTMGS